MLKYAQTLFGVDRDAVTASGITETDLPKPWEYRIFPAPRGIAAKNIIFIGVPPLWEFGYAQIREFGRLAVELSLAEFSSVREITLTLHGPGYGLDEVEAFNSELAGVIDAIGRRGASTVLQLITFAERTKSRAERITATLERLTPAPNDQGDQSPAGVSAESIEVSQLRSVGYDSYTKRHAFIAMPFDGEFDDHYDFAIAPTVRENGLLCERVDQQNFTGDVIAYMKTRIGSASVVLAEVSNPNPNVFLEIGYAWGRGIPTVLICRESSLDIAFDIRGQRIIRYGRIRDLETKLKNELPGILE